MSYLDQLKALVGLPGVDQQKVLQEMFRQQAIERAQAQKQKTATEVKLMQEQMSASQQKALEAHNKAIQAVLEQAHQAQLAQQKAKPNIIDSIGGLFYSSSPKAYQPPPPQCPAPPQKGPSMSSLFFTEFEDEGTWFVQKPPAPATPKTIDALNNVDEVDMAKKKTPLAKEVAKMTKPVQKIIEPVLDPEPSLDHMLVRQARDKMLAERKGWSTEQQRQPSVLNTTLTRLDAWNIVWTALGELDGNAQLEPWLIKRVHQVCDNVMDPSLSALAVDSVLNPKPNLVKRPPPPDPVNPFDREFS